MTIILVILARKEPFELVYAPQVKGHLGVFEPRHQTLIRRSIERQLRHEPNVETRNRKPMLRPVAFNAEWELRCGPNNRFRVSYEVHAERREVHILAIGVKRRERLFIGSEEVE